jgi:L-lactate permease
MVEILCSILGACLGQTLAGSETISNVQEGNLEQLVAEVRTAPYSLICL